MAYSVLSMVISVPMWVPSKKSMPSTLVRSSVVSMTSSDQVAVVAS